MTETEPAPQKPNSIATWLWNPFQRVAGWMALGAGLSFIALTSVTGSFSNTHFDGVLDTHTAVSPAPLWFYLAEGAINWLSLGLVLLVGALIVSRGRFRVVDLLGTQALARWPMLLAALILLLPGYGRVTQAMTTSISQGKLDAASLFGSSSASDLGVFAACLIVILLATAWFVVLAWKSFRVSCDARGGGAVTVFVVGLLIAEVLSKVAIISMATTFLTAG